MKQGILIAGNIIIDYIKIIESYPKKLSLVSINKVKRSLGGLLPNVGISLARLDQNIPVTLLGYVGDDEEGLFATSQLNQYPNLDCTHIRRQAKTSFTDVMTIEATGERTFFTYKGADGLLGFDDFDFEKMDTKMLHIGYILLMDGLDATDDKYGTKLAKILCEAQKRGVQTSVDLVSECSDRFRKLVIPALRYCDFCTINEIEAAQITQMCLRNEKEVLIQENIEPALRKLKGFGVKKWTTIHTPEGAFGLDEQQNYITKPSQKLPAGFIKDSVGAGDAFAAGLLYSAYKGIDYAQALDIANTTAAFSLSEYGATDGVRSIDQVYKKLGMR